MDILLGHTTELECARANAHVRVALAGSAAPLSPEREAAFGIPRTLATTLRKKLFDIGAQTEPVHLIYTAKGGRHEPRGIAAHRWDGPYPAGSILRLAAGLYGCSIPLLYLQLQHGRSLGESVLLGYELCGTYAPGPNGLVHDLSPLAKVNELMAFARAHSSIKGSQQARSALRFVKNGAASPMEAALAALLGLPQRQGGFGLPLPEMNYGIELENGPIYVDLYWPQAHFGIEYESHEWHSGERKFEQDSQRRNRALVENVSLITVTKPEAQSPSAFEDIAGHVAKRLGVRKGPRPKDFPKRHAALRADLFPFWKGSESAIDAEPLRKSAEVFDPEDVAPLKIFGQRT